MPLDVLDFSHDPRIFSFSFFSPRNNLETIVYQDRLWNVISEIDLKKSTLIAITIID